MSTSAQPASEPKSSAVSAAAPMPALLIEVSWEVCSQAGGIYTVLRSKAPAAVKKWGDHYWMIGPYREAAAKIEFEPHPPSGVISQAVAELRGRGVGLYCGRWLITGRPQVVLIDVQSVMKHLGEMKYYFWKDVGIGTPEHDTETNELIAFGYVVADLMGAIHRSIGDRPMLAQFHEWQAGVALPILKHRQSKFGTVFTTHATLVGRSLSAANVNLYDGLQTFDAEAVAREHSILHRFQIERAAAQAADVFTTVSDITAQEAEHFLGRRPEALLPNGLNVERFAAPHEFENLHQKNKEAIHEFVMGHFFPSYTFDLEKTLYFFTAGRYEYRNKGFEIFIESLYELNRRLKAESSSITVVAFVIARANYKGVNVDTLNRQAMFNELRHMCEQIKDDAGKRLFNHVAQGKLPGTDDLLDEYATVRLKRMIHAWKRSALPTIVTHDLVDDAHDPVLCHLRHRNLLNAPDDRVRVIFHPEFITSTSPILGLEYDQFVRGCNIGVFPSYYEPWGYTPMECVIRGVPAISSDLSGFGSYVIEHFPDHDANGLFVARRRKASFETAVYQVTSWLHQITRMSLRQRIQLRNRVESYADSFDWTQMTRYYRAALRMAFQKRYPDREYAPPHPEP